MKNQRINASHLITDYLVTPDVHEMHKVKPGGVITAVVAAALFVAEIFLFMQMANEQLPVATGFAIHGVIVLVLAGYAYVMLRRSRENRFALLLLITVAAIGPFGAAGVLLTIVQRYIAARHAHNFTDLFASLFPQFLKNNSRRIVENIRSGRDESSKDYNVISFIDVLTFGDELQKRSALAKMMLRYHPNFAPVFKKALQDPSNSIRVQAATAIAMIDSGFQERFIKLNTIMKAHPEDTKVTLALAQLYDDYCYTGLLEADHEKTNREQALFFYQNYQRSHPDDQQVNTSIGRILMRNREYKKACDWFRDCIQRGDKSDSISDWFTEALFLCSRYDELRAYILKHPHITERKGEHQVVLSDALQLWFESAA